MDFFFISEVKIDLREMMRKDLKSAAILLKIVKYFSCPIESHNSRDDFTNNLARSIGYGSFLTPQVSRNLFAFSPKSTRLKKSFDLEKKFKVIIKLFI